MTNLLKEHGRRCAESWQRILKELDVPPELCYMVEPDITWETKDDGTLVMTMRAKFTDEMNRRIEEITCD